QRTGRRHSPVLLTLRPPPRSPPFPSTTLFRSPDMCLPSSAASVQLLMRLPSPVQRQADFSTAANAWRALRPDRPLSPLPAGPERSEEHTSELQSRENLVCRLLLEKKNTHSSPR